MNMISHPARPLPSNATSPNTRSVAGLRLHRHVISPLGPLKDRQSSHPERPWYKNSVEWARCDDMPPLVPLIGRQMWVDLWIQVYKVNFWTTSATQRETLSGKKTTKKPHPTPKNCMCPHKCLVPMETRISYRIFWKWLWVIMWVLGSQPEFSTRATGALNCWAILGPL